MSDERGFVFVWALLMVILVGAISSLLLTRSSTLLADSQTDQLCRQSFWAAEGALAEARDALAKDPDYTGGRIELGKVHAISTVTRVDGGWHVEVRATPGGARIEADLEAGERRPTVKRWRR